VQRAPTTPVPVFEAAAFRGAIKPARADGAPLEGTVRNAANREPIAGATVAMSSRTRSGKATAITDDRGRFVIRRLPIASYELTVSYGDVVATTSVELVRDQTVAMAIELHIHAPASDDRGHDGNGDDPPR
jgi:hypothetical protein